MKYLLMFVLLGIIWWSWAKRRHSGGAQSSVQRDPPSEKMLTCAYCAVHMPESEVVVSDGQNYCCEAHRAAALSEKH